MNKIYYIIVLIATIWDVSWCYSKIGEPCAMNNITGTCKPITQCPYAMRQVKELDEKPEICFFHGEEIITCCPTKVDIPFPNEYRSLFDMQNLVKKTDDMTCLYQHRKTILCCENDKPKLPPPEPGCPPVPRPILIDQNGEEILVQHPAWLKCIEYQRYFNVCVTNPEGSHQKYSRQDSCGINKNSGRIIGGQPACDKEFPHMAVIGRTDDTDEKDIEWIGGGSLLSEKYVLTAAHVVRNRGPKATYVLLGTRNKNDIKSGLLYNIIRQIIHDGYKGGEAKVNDIALVELHKSVQFNEFIRPACLPVPDRQVIDVDVIIAGWGITEKQTTSSELLYASVRENSRCINEYKDNFDSEKMICAFGQRNEDSCQGDSGGPLMKRFSNLNCSYSIEGIVSYGTGCGKAGGIYTKVSYYLDWIMKYVWRDEWNSYLEEIRRKQNAEKN